MEIRIAHRFPVAPRAYWEGTRGPELEAEMAREGEVDMQVLERRRTPPTAFDRVRVSPRKELPALAQKALGVARLSYVQEITANDDTMTTTWRVVPDVLPDKVRCGGTSRVVPAPGGCERIIEGEIKVSIPLVGGAVEKIVLEQIERSYERAAEVIRRHFSGA
jgi:hypothetical protein